MRRTALFIFLLVIISISAFYVYITESKPGRFNPGFDQEMERAVSQAKLLYAQAHQQGVDFTSGPCLSNDLIPGWVLDIVHKPRQPIDNFPEYQCLDYLEGKKKHIIELDLSGNLIRAK